MIEVRDELRPGNILARDERETGRMSFAYFCPSCGRIWGRVIRGAGWYVVSRLCEFEPSTIHISGSFFQDFDWWPGAQFGAGEPGLMKFLRDNPRLRQHEARVHLAWLDRVYPPAQGAQT